MINRRDAIKTIGGLAGMAGLSKLVPGCGSNDNGPTGITTYVFLMLENRSYDHYFGARKLLEQLPGDGLTSTMKNLDVNNVPIAPYEPTRDKMCDPDPPHGWTELHNSWNNGACDGFVKSHQLDHSSTTLTDPMQYMTRTQLPISWALADAYTSCDRWFCSLMGPTLPNRAYWHTGTSLGIGKEPDANTRVLNAFSNGIPVPSIYNRLHDKGVDWAYYYGTLPVVSLLANPGPYALDLGPADGTGNVRRFGDPDAKLGQFFKDAEAGKLPSVVYIDPSFYINDDHPPIHPINGQALIAAVYTALATSPQWKNCMLVVTYDENGGFFDHVSPPTTADDTQSLFGQDGFDQLGFRVPTMVIGPYVKKSYVSSVQYCHTSALKHIQNTFGTEPINSRVDAANDLVDCIDMDRLARGEWAPPITLPTINIGDWPMDPNMCMHSGGFRLLDPTSIWADAHPEAFGRLDLRSELPSYDLCIRNYLRAKGVLVSD
ncbi:MAG: phosphoesterase [Myxococcales bacterium]|nr:phosphoesterase [Myxococcales bacterium]